MNRIEDLIVIATTRGTAALSVAELAGLARRYAADPTAWPVRARFEPDRRWYARLAQEADHEAWLLTWLPGQATDLHDHGGSAGAFAVVGGVLTEETVRGGTGPEAATAVRTRLSTTAVRGFGAHHIHRIVNDGPEPAVSVHVYAPALRTMTRYLLDARKLRVVSVSKAGEDW